MNKPINKMDSLFDMGTFPWLVHFGASLNIVFTIWITQKVFLLVGGEEIYLLPFIIIMVALNVFPVIFLRIVDKVARPYPTTSEMNFFVDQHRFSSWVYAIASANMMFWIVFAWTIFNFEAYSSSLLLSQSLAFIATYVPLWRSCYRALRTR